MTKQELDAIRGRITIDKRYQNMRIEDLAALLEEVDRLNKLLSSTRLSLDYYKSWALANSSNPS